MVLTRSCVLTLYTIEYCIVVGTSSHLCSMFWHVNFMINVSIEAEVGNINFKIGWILIWR